MPLLGQASGGFTESSSALRILHIGVRNTVGTLCDDAFTQTNPAVIVAAASISDNIDTSVLGVLSGSVAITRPDQGSTYIGGPGSLTVETALKLGVSVRGHTVQVLGCFINNASGNSFENQPGAASSKGPYVSAMGSYASQLFETQFIGTSVGNTWAIGADLVYTTGCELIASRNGLLMPKWMDTGAAAESCDDVTIGLQSALINADNSSTIIGILLMPSDSTQNEIVFDQRI